MTTLVLGPLLRHVTNNSATIWVEASRACQVEVLGTTARTFCVEGHHYALVIIEGLRPGMVYEYDVRFDGSRVWPVEGDPLPAPVVRTLDGQPRQVLFGSCRASAPHEPPYTLEPHAHPEGRGVDALRARGLEMLQTPIDTWPDLLVLLGDQVYADDPPPRTARRLRRVRRRHDPPPDIVGGFEQYTWLYHEAWKPDVERWMLSVVPSTMIFDDHDMIDDWNISQSWVDDIRREPWWQDHIVGGLMSYWIYQHIGNLSPQRLREEGLLDRLTTEADATDVLRKWALESEQFTPIPGGYHFSYDRHLGEVHLVVMDSRNGRVLEPRARRQIVDTEEWEWISERASEPCRHLLLASSLPVFAPTGVHDLQQWNEAICGGRWGRVAAWLGERLRRAIDLEDWAAFDRSFRAFCELVSRIAGGRAQGDAPRPTPPPPDTITILSGDIHFAYVAGVTLAASQPATCRVRQVVCSPIRNVLSRHERIAVRVSISRVGRGIARVLRSSARRTPAPLAWEIDHGPWFTNNIGEVTFDGGAASLRIRRALTGPDGEALLETVVEITL